MPSFPSPQFLGGASGDLWGGVRLRAEPLVLCSRRLKHVALSVQLSQIGRETDVDAFSYLAEFGHC